MFFIFSLEHTLSPRTMRMTFFGTMAFLWVLYQNELVCCVQGNQIVNHYFPDKDVFSWWSKQLIWLLISMCNIQVLPMLKKCSWMVICRNVHWRLQTWKGSHMVVNDLACLLFRVILVAAGPCRKNGPPSKKLGWTVPSPSVMCPSTTSGLSSHYRGRTGGGLLSLASFTLNGDSYTPMVKMTTKKTKKS